MAAIRYVPHAGLLKAQKANLCSRISGDFSDKIPIKIHDRFPPLSEHFGAFRVPLF
jgi:hypothetical protein